MKIADIITTPIPPLRGVRPTRKGLMKLDAAPPDRARTQPAIYEQSVWEFFVTQRRVLGIRHVFRAQNMRADGGIELDDGRFLVVEAKYRLRAPGACLAQWQIGQFVRYKEAQAHHPVGGLVFFQQFSGDWARPYRVADPHGEEIGWVHWYTDHASLPGTRSFRIDLVRFSPRPLGAPIPGLACDSPAASGVNPVR